MVHSRIKAIHTKEDATLKQKTVRYHIKSGEDCKDPTKTNSQRKYDGSDKKRSKSSRQGKGLVEQCAKKFAKESDASRK